MEKRKYLSLTVQNGSWLQEVIAYNDLQRTFRYSFVAIVWFGVFISTRSNSQWSEDSSMTIDEETAFFVLSQRPAIDFCPDVLNRSCVNESSLGLPVILSKSKLPKCFSSKSSNFFENTSIFLVRSSSCYERTFISWDSNWNLRELNKTKKNSSFETKFLLFKSRCQNIQSNF